MGGIDRLNDLIIDGISSRPELEVRCKRLVTRGKGGLAAAQFVFAAALLKFSVASLLGQIDLLHIHLSIRGSSYRKAVLARAARLFRVPYVVHLHGTDYREFWTGSNTALRHAIDLTFLHAEKILVLGNFWAEVVCDRLPSGQKQNRRIAQCHRRCRGEGFPKPLRTGSGEDNLPRPIGASKGYGGPVEGTSEFGPP